MANIINKYKTKAEREADGYYEDFVKKFKPKKTPDDCMTPEPVYNAIRDWVVKEYNIKPETRIIRPFWPGADYQTEDYSGDCVVIDNPPFSIIVEVVRWYAAKGIRFFLFAPTLTVFSCTCAGTQCIVTDVRITYENGAVVNTSFITNMDEYKIRCEPELQRLIEAACGKPNKISPKYVYPDCVCTAARLGKLSRLGIELRIRPEDTYYIIGQTLDAQRAAKKDVYGGGFLLSEKATADKVAAEKAAEEAERNGNVVIWELSDREKAIVKSLGQTKGDKHG